VGWCWLFFKCFELLSSGFSARALDVTNPSLLGIVGFGSWIAYFFVRGGRLSDDGAVSALAYLTLIPAVLFLLLEPFKNRPNLRFHSWQSILLCIAASTTTVAAAFLAATVDSEIVAELVWLVWFLVWLACAINAAHGKRFKLPVIGNLAEKLAEIRPKVSTYGADG
jgi:uncharacterized membrane protein